MLDGMLARKVGMTQIFAEDGTVLPVTVLKVGPMTVIQKKTKAKDSYDSLQFGFESIEERKLNKPKKGHFKNQAPTRFLREFHTEKADQQVEVGQTFDLSIFKEGEKVDVTGRSKGRGFTGVVKRHHFGGQPATHGHRGHRIPGSIGQRTFPGRVFKGKRLMGHHGDKNVTAIGLKVAKLIPTSNVMLVKGAIPGPNGGLVAIYKSKH